MPQGYTLRPVVGLGVANSNLTGAPCLVADLRQLAISIVSSTGSASRYTFMGTNDDENVGLGTMTSQTVPTAGWSIVTTAVAQGLYVVDTGFRWINCFRDTISVSANSNVTITYQGRA